MGLIEKILTLTFGGGRNILKETAEVFAENSEAGAERDTKLRVQSLSQFGDEFKAPGTGRFDAIMDGINRVPRPALALGTLALFIAAMIDPIWFAARMQGIALVPEPMWWLLGAIVSFYFGARHQMKGQQFQRSLAATMQRAPVVFENLEQLDALGAEKPVSPVEKTEPAAAPAKKTKPKITVAATSNNPALDAWRKAAAK